MLIAGKIIAVSGILIALALVIIEQFLPDGHIINPYLMLIAFVLFVVGSIFLAFGGFFSIPVNLCPDCHIEVSVNDRYCQSCGYELIHYCIECDTYCDTPFCKLCGAEQ